MSQISEMRKRNRELAKALLIAAPHCQGGHSVAGQAIAKAFDVPFPLRMNDLAIAAYDEGFEPDDLWPWWKQMREAA